MIRGLRWEWYTNTHNKVLLILLIVCFMLFYFFSKFAGGKLEIDMNTINITEFNQDIGSNFSTLDEIGNWFESVGKAENRFHTLLADPTFVSFLCLFFSATYIGMGFSEKSINLPLLSGVSRGATYLAKCISFFVVAAMFLIISFLFTQLCTAGIPFVFSFRYFIKRICLMIMIDLAVLAPTFSLAYLFRNPFKIACASLVYNLIIMILNRVTAVSQYMPINFISLYLSKRKIVILTSSTITHVLLVCGLWILISTFVGWLFYRRMDLK